MSTREQYNKRAKQYWQRYYSQLEGARIDKYLGNTEGDEYDEGFPTLLLTYPDGQCYTIQVSCDPEGNGGGFLFLPFEPVMDDYDKAHKLNNYADKEQQ